MAVANTPGRLTLAYLCVTHFDSKTLPFVFGTVHHQYLHPLKIYLILLPAVASRRATLFEICEITTQTNGLRNMCLSEHVP